MNTLGNPFLQEANSPSRPLQTLPSQGNEFISATGLDNIQNLPSVQHNGQVSDLSQHGEHSFLQPSNQLSSRQPIDSGSSD